MERRSFLRTASVLALGTGLTPSVMNARVVNQSRQKSFVLWQLPSQVDTIGNSYVLVTENGKVIVMDGGVPEEAPFLRGFIAALGNEVETWFVSHPHGDHVGALTKILQAPNWVTNRPHPEYSQTPEQILALQKKLVIKNICHSEFSPEYLKTEGVDAAKTADDFYQALHSSGIPVNNLTSPGAKFDIDGVHFKILTVTNETFKTNTYNNASMVIRVWDKEKSVLFTGDLGREGGDLLLNSPFRKDLDCDYLQMAHHGQNGVSKDFYRTLKFSACLWPSPSWVYNNDAGKGYNTHILQTIETREWMKELGIQKHYVSCEGLYKI
jgi:beta-lactamase superfamily II metal-dependent hydrolase